jgi:hypothetical protein
MFGVARTALGRLDGIGRRWCAGLPVRTAKGPTHQTTPPNTCHTARPEEDPAGYRQPWWRTPERRRRVVGQLPVPVDLFREIRRRRLRQRGDEAEPTRIGHGGNEFDPADPLRATPCTIGCSTPNVSVNFVVSVIATSPQRLSAVAPPHVIDLV